jgi:hypothetical protein
MPPPDGYGRAHWEAVADGLLDAVVPYAAPDFAQIRLPGRASSSGAASDGLEGFARTFLLAAFRIAGAGGEVPPRLLERYADGLAAGTDPAHPYAWPAITDRSQPIVEAASVALGLAETRPWLYDRLPPAVQQRVLAWLAGIIGKETWPCNWVLFTVVVEQFLADAGGPARPEEIAAALAQVDEWYVGDGWYTDGAGQHYDYYVGWAIHLYTVLWARMAGDAGAGRAYGERLRAYLEAYQHFFASDGGPVHQGRSLTYRFATVAPLWLGALADATPLPAGRTRRIASGVLRHFLDRGVPDADGLLRLGWYHPYLPVTQAYSGPASPYWASKGFLGLLLAPDHPVWTDDEEPSPVDLADRTLALPGPGWLLHSTRSDGVVRLVNHGSDANHPPPSPARDDPHYAKFGYASHAAPETGADAWSRNVDGHLAVQPPEDRGRAGPSSAARAVTRRRRIERIAVFDRFAASRYVDELPTGAVTVRTASLVRGAWEFRLHEVAGPGGHTVREGGFALAGQDPPDAQLGDRAALVHTPAGLTGAIVGLHGWTGSEVVRSYGGNAFGPHSATPCLHGTLPPAGGADGAGPDGAGRPGGDAVTAMFVSLVTLTGDPVEPDALRRAIRVTVDGDLVCLQMPDHEMLAVRLGRDPAYTRQSPGNPPISWHPHNPGGTRA